MIQLLLYFYYANTEPNPEEEMVYTEQDETQ